MLIDGRRARFSTLSVLGFGPFYEWVDYQKSCNCGSNSSEEGESSTPYAPPTTEVRLTEQAAVKEIPKERAKPTVRSTEAPATTKVRAAGPKVVQELPKEKEKLTVRFAELPVETEGAESKIPGGLTEGAAVATPAKSRWKTSGNVCQEIGVLRGVALRMTVPNNPRKLAECKCAEGPRVLNVLEGHGPKPPHRR